MVTTEWNGPDVFIFTGDRPRHNELVRKSAQAPVPPKMDLHREPDFLGLYMYDLHKLGWDSFQKLCLTITREILGQTVESFLSSHDGGRDGAFTGTWCEDGKEDLSGQFVIQCKFTGKPGHNITISDLSDEIEKARRLVDEGRCDSYVLMTNAGVSGSLDEEIKKRLKAAGVKQARTLGANWIIEQIVESQKLRTLVPRLYGLGDLSQILDERAYEQTRVVLEFMKEDLAKVVVTDAYRKAVDAMNQHGFVLLIGEPAAGKTTIASLLAMEALDEGNSLVSKFEDPKSVVEHWNPHEPSQFIWVDDAFGVTQYEDSLVKEWNRDLTKIKTMLNKGVKIVMTSRDYIYNRARLGLKDSAFPLLNESQVVIDVHDLTLDEKRQILYNHIRMGNQPNHFRSEIKPYLEAVVNHPRFIPEIARRLADPLFTRGLCIAEHELDQFVEKRELFLRNLLEKLDIDSKAALALIYMRNGYLESPIRLDASEPEAVQRLGSDLGDIVNALQALKGSLVTHSDTNDESAWQFRHPTIGDSYATILSENPESMEIFVRGSAPEQLIRQVTCGNVGLENAVVVPKSLFAEMLNKLEDLHLSSRYRTSRISRYATRRELLEFLASRCSSEFLSLYLQRNPDLLDDVSTPGLSLSAVPEVGMAKRLHEFGLLPNEYRKAFIETVTDYLLNGEDGGALNDTEAKSLFTESEFDDLLKRVREELLPRIREVRLDRQYDHDSDIPPDAHMQPLEELLRSLKALFQAEQDLIQIFDIELTRIDQWVSEHMPEETNTSRQITGTARLTVRQLDDRSIFDDIDDD